MGASLFRSPEKQRERDLFAAELRRAHARNPGLGRALARLRRAWERRQSECEGGQLALMDRCWWRRMERAEVMREVSREISAVRHGAGREDQTKN